MSVSKRASWWLILDSINIRFDDKTKMLITEQGELVELEMVKLNRKLHIFEEAGCYLGCEWTNAINCWSHLQLVCRFQSFHAPNESLMLAYFAACILLKLWSLYVFVHVSATTPLATAQVHITVPACVLDIFCSNLKGFSCSA